MRVAVWNVRRVARVIIPAMLLLAGSANGAGAPAIERWSGAWGYAPADADPRHDEQLPPGTYRYRARLTQHGSAVALTFSNAEGREPVSIATASIGLARGSTGTDIDRATLRPVTFSGQVTADLPVGRTILSDSVPFTAAVGQDVVVSVTFSTATRPARTNLGLSMAFANGLLRDDGKAAGFAPLQARPYLTMIATRDVGDTCTVVAFGDSITDGFDAVSTTARGWPGRLAERLAALPDKRRCGVVNMGVSGNRLLRDGRGLNALDRFWRDVASVPGATHVILLEGINDIGNAGSNGEPVITPAMLADGYRQFVVRAHALGLRVIGGTMTPAVRAGYMSVEKDRLRKAANDAIRHSGTFDGVIDFDTAVRDPGHPDELRAAFDPGDHLHMNDAGYRAMGDAIDLDLFRKTAPGTIPRR